jgi:hypothetical protein
MKKISDLFYTLFFLFLLVTLFGNLAYDLTHPEIWSDWKHDPRWYGPALVVLVLLITWSYRTGEREARRRQERTTRLHAMKKLVDGLLWAGRRDEAAKANSFYRSALWAKNKEEEDAAAEHYSDFVNHLTQKRALP